MTGPVDAARGELRDVLHAARAGLARARAGRPSADELAALQRQALGGGLGPEMRRIACRVHAGSTTWVAVLEDGSPDGDLTRRHVERMAAVHGHDLRRWVR